MSFSPSSELRPTPQRRLQLSSRTCIWGAGFLLAVLAVGAVVRFAGHLPGPVWLRMTIFLFPPVLALVAGGMCFFNLSRDLVKKSDWEAARPAPRRGGLLRDALHLGSPAWSIGFVLAAFVASSLISLSQSAALPLWLRGFIALIPAVPLAMYLRSIGRDTAEVDELAVHIRRDAYGFVFCAMIGLFVCVHLLEEAGVMPGFRWGSTQLVLIMFALLIVGTAISSRRFR